MTKHLNVSFISLATLLHHIWLMTPHLNWCSSVIHFTRCHSSHHSELFVLSLSPLLNCIYFIVHDEYLYLVYVWNAIYNDSLAFFNCCEENTLHSLFLSTQVCKINRIDGAKDKWFECAAVYPVTLDQWMLYKNKCQSSSGERRESSFFSLALVHLTGWSYTCTLAVCLCVCDCLLAVKSNWINCNWSRQLCSSCNCWCEFYSHQLVAHLRHVWEAVRERKSRTTRPSEKRRKEKKKKKRTRVYVYTPSVTSDKTFTSLIGLTSAGKKKEREEKKRERERSKYKKGVSSIHYHLLCDFFTAVRPTGFFTPWSHGSGRKRFTQTKTGRGHREGNESGKKVLLLFFFSSCLLLLLLWLSLFI